MGVILIDTDITSFIFKGSNYADPYLPLLPGHQLALSFMTVAELFQWAILHHWGDRRLAQLEEYLLNYLVIPTDLPLCRQWAKVRGDRQSIGRPISPQDAWIAATALRHNLPLVTHNVKDFLDIPNLQLLTPP
ncbi:MULTISPECIES: type II toxin-antitoxin system VapC family toxin [Planktothricoides]|uniref:Type II toxin-antitoxin system VapC family toxin n=2 Tax=Planktothricoides raciborskii TaxID=132608 RepID=A0AAU8JBI7_9CYAN|nr:MULTISPECIES: type II toxin-antitoxin system VapC family toxin [Planktothricoides]KOR38511.1 twitching motility protein PilT [Planktothricoides sp. SR001]MBD2545415.1 type II toxin-antitoxin system VapC family toxin [Planktothricoides raciborskii FACHB-1370]